MCRLRTLTQLAAIWAPLVFSLARASAEPAQLGFASLGLAGMMVGVKTARRAMAALVLLLAATCSALVHAQTEAEKTLAKGWFDQGVEAVAEKRWAKALALFERASKVKATVQIHLAIVLCQERLGRLVEALGNARRALDLARNMPDDKPTKAQLLERATKRHDALQARVPKLVIRLAADYPKIKLALDGKELTSAAVGAPLPLQVGRHELTASAPGHMPFRTQLVASERKTGTVVVKLVAKSPAPAEPRKAASASWWLGGSLLAVGIGGMVVGGVLAHSYGQKLDALCLDQSDQQSSVVDTSDPAIQSEWDSIVSVRAGSIVGFAAGGLALVGGSTILAMTALNRQDSPQLALLPLPGGAVLLGRF